MHWTTDCSVTPSVSRSVADGLPKTATVMLLEPVLTSPPIHSVQHSPTG